LVNARRYGRFPAWRGSASRLWKCRNGAPGDTPARRAASRALTTSPPPSPFAAGFLFFVIASAAKQSNLVIEKMDCVVANAPRNDVFWLLGRTPK
jgi:hypothetical protein